VGLTQQEGQFDVALEVVLHGRALWGALKYDADLLDGASAACLAAHFEALLRAAVEHPDAALSALPLGPEPPARDRA
jgi:non-ribosomal peptide synthetase component F